MKKSIIKVIESWEIDTEQLMAKLVIAIIVFLIFFALGRILKKIAFKINSKVLKKFPDIQSILSTLIYYFFLFTGIFFFLKVIGLEQYFTKIMAGAGIIGIIAGFALKDIASNAFAGLLLFIEKPFKRGDWVQVDGHFGQIVNIGSLTTILSNKTGQEVSISNQLIYSGVFINYSIYKRRSIRIQATVLNYSDLPELKKLLTDELKKLDLILANENIHFYVLNIGSNDSFTFELYFFVHFEEENDFLQTVSDSVVAIKKVNEDNNISIINTKWLSDEDNVTSSGEYGLGG